MNIVLTALTSKGRVGLTNLKPQQKGVKVKVLSLEPYTKMLLISKRLSKIISIKDIENFFLLYPHLLKFSIKNGIDYSLEVLEE